MSKPSDDIQREIHALLRKHYHDSCWGVLEVLECVMESKDGYKLVRLMQKWGACV